MTYSSVNLAAELEVSSIDIVETMTYHASGNIASTSRTVNIVSL
jgi:hypothetical protein